MTLDENMILIYGEALKKAIKRNKYAIKKLADLPKDADRTLKKELANKVLASTNIVENIAKELAKAGVDVSEIIQSDMNKVFLDNRNKVIKDITKLVPEAAFAIYNERTVRTLVKKNQSAFTKIAYKNLGKDEIIVKRLKKELLEATLLGEGQDLLIKRIRKVTGQSLSQGRRVAQTERNRVQSEGRYDAGKEAVEMDIPIKKRWSTKFDNSRPTHIKVNREEVPLDKPFGNGLMFPGDPNAPAKEVCNCRCVMTIIVDAKSDELKKVREDMAKRREERIEERGSEEQPIKKEIVKKEEVKKKKVKEVAKVEKEIKEKIIEKTKVEEKSTKTKDTKSKEKIIKNKKGYDVPYATETQLKKLSKEEIDTLAVAVSVNKNFEYKFNENISKEELTFRSKALVNNNTEAQKLKLIQGYMRKNKPK